MFTLADELTLNPEAPVCVFPPRNSDRTVAAVLYQSLNHWYLPTDTDALTIRTIVLPSMLRWKLSQTPVIGMQPLARATKYQIIWKN